MLIYSVVSIMDAFIHVVMDMASGPDRSVMTIYPRHSAHVGDRVMIDYAPRSHVHYVVQLINHESFEFKLYIRPSKGKRRHIRNMKAQTRKRT